MESANNTDISCRVKTDSKLAGGAIKIKWVIEDGTSVGKQYKNSPQFLWASTIGLMANPFRQGHLLAATTYVPDRLQKLIELDSSPLHDELKSQQIKVDQAYGEWIQALENYKIAEEGVEVAKLDLEKYTRGDYFLAKNDIISRLETAKSDYKMWEERASWSKRMALKRYVSLSQADADSARKRSAALTLESVKKELDVLEKFTKKREAYFWSSKVGEAKSKLIQAETDRNIKKAIYYQELAKRNEIEDEIAKCVIYASEPGLVVYYIPPQSRFGRGTQQSIIAPGEPVSYNQKLMQIPDLSRMQVKAQIPEAMVTYLRGEDPDYPSRNQRVLIRADAFPETVYPGHVKMVKDIASQQSWLSSDVKVYETIISIDKEVSKLKPGMSAEVTIFAYESPEPVLAIPLQAVVGNIRMGANRKCFVVDEDGYAELRDIEIGLSNEIMVEVKSGLKEGETIALDPGSLLPADSDLKPTRARMPKGEQKKRGGEKQKGKSKSNGNPNNPKFGPGGSQNKPDMQAKIRQFQQASPEERRKIINRIPDPAIRAKVEQKMRDKGLKIAP